MHLAYGDDQVYDPLHWIKMSAETPYIDVYNPGLTITKTTDKTCAAIDEYVDFTVTVTNTGDVTMWFTLYDAFVMWNVYDVEIGPGKTIIYTGDASMISADPDTTVIFVNELHYPVAEQTPDGFINSVAAEANTVFDIAFRIT